MKKAIFIASMLTTVILLIISCSKSNTPGGGGGDTTPDCSVAKTFAGDVNPIIQSFCNIPGCHTSGSSNGPGPLTNYSQIFSARSAIRDAVSTGAMPQNTTLSATQRNKIICWIDSGASNN